MEKKKSAKFSLAQCCVQALPGCGFPLDFLFFIPIAVFSFHSLSALQPQEKALRPGISSLRGQGHFHF